MNNRIGIGIGITLILVTKNNQNIQYWVLIIMLSQLKNIYFLIKNNWFNKLQT